ncbi:MAG: hypothetical protein QW810_07095 [Nitrososphaerota archaeon]
MTNTNGIRIVFVDTANNSKNHCCYDPVKDRFFEVNSLTELKDFDEVYIDSSLFQSMWNEIQILLKNGKRVFYFRRPWKWKTLRETYASELRIFNKNKSDQGDAWILSRVPRTSEWFREITMIDAEIRPLISIEKAYYKLLQRLRSIYSLKEERDVKKYIEETKERLHEIRRKVVEKAYQIIPKFDKIYERIGLNADDLNGLYGLATTLVYIGWPKMLKSYHKTIEYLGLYPGKKMHVQGNSRRLFVIFTNAVAEKRGWPWPPRLKYQQQLLKELICILQEMKGST